MTQLREQDQSDMRRVVTVGALAIIALGATTYLAAANIQLKNEMEGLYASQEQAFMVQQDLESTVLALRDELEHTVEERDQLSEKLSEEQDRNEAFEDQIEDITGTVGKLDKLSKTDEELLEKYSKVYFLNEHYRPVDLSEIDEEYLYDEEDDQYLHGEVLPFFEDMMEEAKDDGIDLWVVSAFRSFDEQGELKGHYTVTYGTGANTFSADQGYSEHQLGTTIDVTTTGINGGLEGFEATEAYEWMQDNAHEYGFTLSYPQNNSYYIFEPWHWRFVGVDLAEHLHDEGVSFYDMSQREIDEYLISIFD